MGNAREDTSGLEASLRSLVQYYLDRLMHANATFLCERLVACNPAREENVLLLATCHVGESSELRAHAILQGCRLPESRFLLATCCINLGRLAEAERVLLEDTDVLRKGPKESRDEILADPCPIPFGAAGLRLLGLACQGSGRRESAEEYFRLSLELDPLMWVSIQSLCELGVEFDVDRHFEVFLTKAAAEAGEGGEDAGGGGGGGGWRRDANLPQHLPWTPYLPFFGRGTTERRVDFAPGDGSRPPRVDDAMPPPPPADARSAMTPAVRGVAHEGAAGGEDEHSTPIRGGALFGTPTPGQWRAVSSGLRDAHADVYGGANAQFMTPAGRTPAASHVRLNVGNATAGTDAEHRRVAREPAGIARGNKSSARRGGGGGAGGVGVSARARGTSAAAGTDGIGHLLGLGARLGTFFPPAVGPGPVPGLDELVQEASDVISNAEAHPPTPGYRYTGPALPQETSGVRGRFLATPGLTPIPTARTPGVGGGGAGGGGGGDNMDADTPSMFLTDLLQASPSTAAVSRMSLGAATPAYDDVRGMAAERTRVSRRTSAGGDSAAIAGTRETAAGGNGRDRAPRGAGGRRVGGRLSFSSAVGADDASGGEGAEDRAAGAAGARAPARTRRHAGANTPARSGAQPSTRSTMRPPPPAGGGMGGGGDRGGDRSSSSSGGGAAGGSTPASAALTGRAARAAASTRRTAAANAALAGEGTSYSRRRAAHIPASAMEEDQASDAGAGKPLPRSDGGAPAGTAAAAAAAARSSAAEKTPAPQAHRRPATRATTRKGVASGARQSSQSKAADAAGSKAASAKASGGSGGGGSSGGDQAQANEEKLTRGEWQRLQYDETLSFAAKLISELAEGGTGGSSGGGGGAPLEGDVDPPAASSDKSGDREKVMAALAVLKAAQASSAALAARRDDDASDGGMAGSGAAAGVPEPGPGDEKTRAVSREGLRAVASLLAILGKAYQHLMQFRCPEAVKELERLNPEQYCTGWVLHQIGRAYFERADYANAKSALESMQRYDPHRLEGLDLLSTTLWHLKREVELSYLAQKVSEFDRLSPYTWCVVGNCFSLQKEHETALRFFQRAIQLDSDMTYAYTLCGHEYVANEDFDKAVACFRMAIRTDRRHYNAWYGLGSIYHRQEKYDMAEYHFRRALAINPQSSVLRVYLGMVLHANKRYLDALDMLGEASKTEPSNPQASFQRANVLMSMERYAEALTELETVRNNVPKESAVYFLMGKVCKKLGNTDAAMRHFTIALDLHNKDKNLIKAAVDRLNEPDLDEEEKF